MQPETHQEKPLHEFMGCRSSSSPRDSRQPMTQTFKGSLCPARVAGESVSSSSTSSCPRIYKLMFLSLMLMATPGVLFLWS